MNFSTVPPWRSRARFISKKYRLITARRASGVSGSPESVRGLGSAKTRVTVFRLSRGLALMAREEPHMPQNWKRLGFSSPQFGQIRVPSDARLAPAVD